MDIHVVCIKDMASLSWQGRLPEPGRWRADRSGERVQHGPHAPELSREQAEEEWVRPVHQDRGQLGEHHYRRDLWKPRGDDGRHSRTRWFTSGLDFDRLIQLLKSIDLEVCGVIFFTFCEFTWRALYYFILISISSNNTRLVYSCMFRYGLAFALLFDHILLLSCMDTWIVKFWACLNLSLYLRMLLFV